MDLIREQLEKSLRGEISLDGKDVFIYGAGNTSLLYGNCFINENIEPSAYLDKKPGLRGRTVNGKKVICPTEAPAIAKGHSVILICSSLKEVRDDIKAYLSKTEMADWEIYSVDEYVFRKNAQSVLSVYDRLEDDISRKTYLNLILARLDAEAQDHGLVCGRQYFGINEFRMKSSGEVFVDVGAYVGDTIEQYIFERSGIFDKIFAFEPCKRNFEAMSRRVKRLGEEWALSCDRITLEELGISDVGSRMQMRDVNDGTPSLGAALSAEPDTDNGSEVEVVSIDEYFADIPISFIKADIEGYEEKMLRGAKKVIGRDKPKMAVCIYHNASDMFRIPMLIAELEPSYRFAVRQHYYDTSETVLYAY